MACEVRLILEFIFTLYLCIEAATSNRFA